MRIHFIAVGGSAMHNLAIAMHKKGYIVTGSDDEIFEPSKSRLASYGLLPKETGWNENNISENIDAVILGMHARADNPELLKAQRLGIKIYSYPEYLYEQSKSKIRIVIGGSHGKTTITSMIMHVQKYHEKDFDYMVGAQIEGFDVMVKLTESAPFMIFEGDEYLTSPIDRRPKFHLYKPHIALISGIAWDHINVFPTFENYTDQFRIFISQIEPGGSLIWCEDDKTLASLAAEDHPQLVSIPYSLPEYRIVKGETMVSFEGNEYPLKIFGKHNLLNLNGARLVCNSTGISNEQFFEAIVHFKGAAKRLESIASSETCHVFKDFAHAPSKLVATVNAVKEQYPSFRLIACLELHTFSSLNKEYLLEYAHGMDDADIAIVYFNPHTAELKKMPSISGDEIKKAFKRDDLKVFTNSEQLSDYIKSLRSDKTNLLMMSSGNYDGIDLKNIANHFIQIIN